MHALIITHVFWPETFDFKNMALARELVRGGHEVTVLTAFPNYPLGRLYDGYKMSWRQWESIDGIRVLRVPLYPDHSSSGLKRVLNYMSFTLSASTIGLLLARKPDVVFLYAPPMTLGLTAALFKFLKRAPILMDVLDLWPEAIVGSGMVSSNIVIEGAGIISKLACRVADKITVPTEGFAERLRYAGVPKDKLTVIPNWADRNVYRSADKNRDFGKRFGLESKFCVIHAGNIGPFQDIGNVLAAAELVRDLDELRIVFVGGGSELDRMKRIKDERKLDNVVFAGSYPTKEMAGIFAWGDALLVSLRADPYLDINLPSKLPTYMASGKPVIACAAGEAAALVADNNLGLCCKPGDSSALATALRRFVSLPQSARDEMGRNSLSLFDKAYDKDKLVCKYVKMLAELSANG